LGFRARKSFKLAPGVRLNVSKTGFGVSAGAGPARYSVHSSGRRTVSARTGVPGLSYQESVGGGRRSAPQPAPAKVPKPGLFAPKGEKALYKAIKAQDAKAISAVGAEHGDYRLISYSLAGLMLSNSDPDSAEPLLQEALDTGSDPAEDKFAAKYLYTRLQISLAPGITAELPVNRDAVGLALAELRQERGDLDGAIEGVEQLEPSTYAAVSLADLYAAAGRFDEVIALTEGLRNEDDASALLLTYRGMALRQKGFTDAAHEALKEALRARSRSAAIRHLALVERADNYLAQNKKAMARKDLERILAEDSTVEGVADRLAALQEG
jgi:tetratricopeptide (TPR) repeat protein